MDPDKIPPELWKQMNITPEQFKLVQARMAEREEHAPAVGSIAPDFTLKRLSPAGKLTEERVRLSDLRGQPVALVFGSYT
jgi:hypothetical protein